MEAARKCGILHRDISLGNIMIDADGCGILNDWDHSRELPQDPPPGAQSNDSAAGNAGAIPFRTVSTCSPFARSFV